MESILEAINEWIKEILIDVYKRQVLDIEAKKAAIFLDSGQNAASETPYCRERPSRRKSPCRKVRPFCSFMAVSYTHLDVYKRQAYYIAGIKQPEIARREGIHSSKVSVAIHRGLRNMRRCYDDLFQAE